MDCPSRRFSCSLPCLIIRAEVNRFQVTMDTMEQPIEADSTLECQPRLGDAARRPLPKQIKKRDRSGANFRKRWRTLVKTGCELHQDYGARVYFSISIPRTQKTSSFDLARKFRQLGGVTWFRYPYTSGEVANVRLSTTFYKIQTGLVGSQQGI
jgi:hypothetical protein